MEQVIKNGYSGLDCRYLNFAPQCQGWMQLTRDGGYGSFIILWSNVWKLTTAASIPIALTEAWEEGKIKEGDLVCLAAFGSGFTWGSALIRW